LDETLSHLIASRDLGYCPISLYDELRNQIEEIRRLLNGYITWLKTKKVGENEPGAKLVIRELPPEYLIDPE
jgi:23S rRNA-intervening sequence protein